VARFAVLLGVALAAAACGGDAMEGELRVDVEIEQPSWLVGVANIAREGSFSTDGTLVDSGRVIDVSHALPDGRLRIERLLSGRDGTITVELVGVATGDGMRGRWRIANGTLRYAHLEGAGEFEEVSGRAARGRITIVGTMEGAVARD
jgi:hypothetical protein